MQKDPQLICEDKIDPKTKKHILLCSLNVRRQAGKHVSEPIKMILKGSYFRERASLHKLLDVTLIGLLALAMIAVIYLIIPKYTPDFIDIDASIAPEQVISGDLSTLTFKYENNSDEVIRDVELELKPPEHFELEQTSSLSFDLGDIAPDEYGYLHVKGTMFGDVGGEQVFTTTLSYTYSEQNISDTKTIEHVFEPVRSALELELVLPKNIITHQQVQGEIKYSNTGSIDFPNLIINPQWPDGFILESSEPFHVNEIQSGEAGSISFTGRLGSNQDSMFIFEPSFTFDDTSYKQEILSDMVSIMPTPLEISHSISESSIIPGSYLNVDINYQNVSDYEIKDIELDISSDLDIFSGIEQYQPEVISSLEPGQSGSTSIKIPVDSYISISETDVYESISITTTSSAEFKFTPEDELVTVNTLGNSATLPLTSPILLSSFGRYWGPSGDQLGRGPIPPSADETTKYWILWNVSGTTNDLSNVKIQADLGSHVTLTGRQSVSTGSSITSENGTVTWSTSEIDSTLSPENPIVGIAFEVAITPASYQVGTTPTLLGMTSFTATDSYTGEFVSSSSPVITTYLPYDEKALEYGGVVEE